jgi:hypothetical protein
MVEFSKHTSSWKIKLKLITGNVVISEVAAVIYGELFGTPKSIPL